MGILGYKKSAAVREHELAQFLKARGLAGWLELATEGLESTAKRRIAHEIETHYTEAVADHMAAGQSTQAAQSTALSELGDPDVAAENFQRTYLTVSEAKALWLMEWAASKPFLSFWFLPLNVVPVFVAIFISVYYHQNYSLRFLALTVLVEYLCRRLIPRLLYWRTLSRYALLKQLAFVHFLWAVASTLCFTLFVYTITPHVVATVICGLFWLRSNTSLWVWKKVRKIGDVNFPPASAN